MTIGLENRFCTAAIASVSVGSRSVRDDINASGSGRNAETCACTKVVRPSAIAGAARTACDASS